MPYEYTLYDRKSGRRLVSGTAEECATSVGYAPATIRQISRSGGSRYIKVERRKVGCAKADACFYTVYLRKDDSLICCGTSYECAIAMNLGRKDSRKARGIFYTIVCKTRKGELSKYAFCVERPDGTIESF